MFDLAVGQHSASVALAGHRVVSVFLKHEGAVELKWVSA
jgi:glycine cleavage system protein P-like pyridoxal-binding family